MKEVGSYNFNTHGVEIPTDKILRLRNVALNPVQETIKYLDNDFSLDEVFVVLGDAADSVKDKVNDGLFEGNEIDSDFLLMVSACKNNNVDTPDFYQGVFFILKRAGCTREQVKLMIDHYQQRLDADSVSVMRVIVSQNSALTLVFGPGEEVSNIEVYE